MLQIEHPTSTSIGAKYGCASDAWAVNSTRGHHIGPQLPEQPEAWICAISIQPNTAGISKIHENPMTWEACGPKACRWNAPRLILFLASLRERVAMAQFRNQSTWFRALCSSKMESASVVCWASKLLWCYLGCVCNLNTWRLGLKSVNYFELLHFLQALVHASQAGKFGVRMHRILRLLRIPQIGSTLGSHTCGPDSSTFWNWWHSDSCLSQQIDIQIRRSLADHFSWPQTLTCFECLMKLWSTFKTCAAMAWCRISLLKSFSF